MMNVTSDQAVGGSNPAQRTLILLDLRTNISSLKNPAQAIRKHLKSKNRVIERSMKY